MSSLRHFFSPPSIYVEHIYYLRFVVEHEYSKILSFEKCFISKHYSEYWVATRMRIWEHIRKIAWRRFLPAFIATFFSLTWIPLTYKVFNDCISERYPSPSGSGALIVFAVYYVGIAASAILGAIICSRAREKSFILWMLAGTIASATLITIPSNSMEINILVSLFLGASTGVGLPSCLAYFGDVTSVENRGRYGGITWSAVGFGALLFGGLLFSLLSTVYVSLALAIWRVIGLFGFLLTKRKETDETEPETSKYSFILRRTDFILYLIPWVMFCFVNFVETPLLGNFLGDPLSDFIGLVELGISGIFALVGGILADFVGRKRVIITGFVMLGIEYAVLSLFYELPVSWYVYTVFDGIAWGFFASVFFMTLWGDLAGTYKKDKYYALGGLPYLIGGFLSILITPYVGIILLGTAFSLASFFLFVAVLPLLYAPETLPEKRLKERELKEYIEKAKKAKEKQT